VKLQRLEAPSDNLSACSYDQLMAGAQAYIVVKISTKNPIELGDFVSEFTSVSSQYDKFMRENHPDLSPGAQMFVKQVRRGSIIFELLPYPQGVDQLRPDNLPHNRVAAIQALGVGDVHRQFAGGLRTGR
jgi:hypothetical protein